MANTALAKSMRLVGRNLRRLSSSFALRSPIVNFPCNLRFKKVKLFLPLGDRAWDSFTALVFWTKFLLLSSV